MKTTNYHRTYYATQNIWLMIRLSRKIIGRHNSIIVIKQIPSQISFSLLQMNKIRKKTRPINEIQYNWPNIDLRDTYWIENLWIFNMGTTIFLFGESERKWTKKIYQEKITNSPIFPKQRKTFVIIIL